MPSGKVATTLSTASAERNTVSAPPNAGDEVDGGERHGGPHVHAALSARGRQHHMLRLEDQEMSHAANHHDRVQGAA
jgi:hypothetical protein